MTITLVLLLVFSACSSGAAQTPEAAEAREPEEITAAPEPVAAETKETASVWDSASLAVSAKAADYSQGIVLEETAVYQLPSLNACQAGQLSKGAYVEILTAAEVLEDAAWQTEPAWLLVRFTVFDTPCSNLGWVSAASVTQYTQETKDQLTSPLFLRDGQAYCWDDGSAHQFDAGSDPENPCFLIGYDSEQARYCIGSAGGWTAYVDSLDDLIYPPFDAASGGA